MTELVQRPLGRQDSYGYVVEAAHDPDGMVWARQPGYGLSTG